MAHHRPPLGPHEVIVARVRDRIDALVKPTTTLHTQWLLRPPWLQLRPYPHVVEHPSLIDQLRAGTSASTAGSSGGGPGSKPPANLTPLSELETIRTEATRWVVYAWRLETTGVVDALRVLAERASTIEHLDDLRDLDWHVTRWWAHARLVTTWESAPMKVYAHCDQCGTRGSLQVRCDPITAVCFACGSAWDSSTIGQLGEHVRIMLEHHDLLPPIEHDAVAAMKVFDTPPMPTVLHGTTFDT